MMALRMQGESNAILQVLEGADEEELVPDLMGQPAARFEASLGVPFG